MIRKYIIEADDSIKGFDEEIARLEREWGAEEIEPCKDCISRESLRQKLQEHHDFFVNAYGDFKDMTFKEKSRVDEIDNCIAMVVNAPSVIPSIPDVENDFNLGYNCGYADAMIDIAESEEV